MMQQKLSLWSLLFLISVPYDVRAFDFGNLLYSLNFCRGPGRFCPEPNCMSDGEHHLCNWYDCSSSFSGRYLEDSNSTCTFFGSQASCGGDRTCMKACKELNGGTCPQCISFYQAGNCQDSVSFSASSSSSSSSSSPSSNSTYNANANGKSGLFSVNLVFYYVLGGVLLVGAATAAMMRHRNPSGPLAEQLHPDGGDGLVQARIDAVEAGTAEPISTEEDRTNFRRSQPENMMA